MGSLGAEEVQQQIIDLPTTLADTNSLTTDNQAATSTMPLLALNHVSYVCKSLADSVKFYVSVLGFVLVQRPSSFEFQGAWLFNHGIGVHLLESDDVERKNSKINTKDNHISFQCSDLKMMIQKLEEMKIEYVTAQVEEGGIKVDQLFFHDPDGYMVEICNCHNLPILPLSSCPLNVTLKRFERQMSTSMYNSQQGSEPRCSSEVDANLMENLMTDMISIAF